MKNKDKISASEINKFVYCPYQWYYERKYGASKIRQIYKEGTPGPDKDGINRNFEKGRQFHRNFEEMENDSNTAIRVILIIIILLAVALFIWFEVFKGELPLNFISSLFVSYIPILNI